MVFRISRLAQSAPQGVGWWPRVERIHGKPRAQALAEARNCSRWWADASAADVFRTNSPAANASGGPGARAGRCSGGVGVDEAVSALEYGAGAGAKPAAALRERLKLSIVFITHDLRVAAQICTSSPLRRMASGRARPEVDVFGNRGSYTARAAGIDSGGDFALKDGIVAPIVTPRATPRCRHPEIP